MDNIQQEVQQPTAETQTETPVTASPQESLVDKVRNHLSGGQPQQVSQQAAQEIQGKQEAKTDVPPSSFQNVSKDEDGNFIWKSSTGTTIYKGKTEAELFANMANGIVAKDEHIAKLSMQQQPSVQMPQSFGQQSGQQSNPNEIAYPDRSKIYQDVFSQNSLDPEMLRWGWPEWTQYGIDNNIPDYGIAEIRQRAKEAQKIAEETYSQQNLNAVNTEIAGIEIKQIDELCKENGIQLTQEQINHIVDNAFKNRQDGVLVSGYMTRLASKLILDSLKNKLTNTQSDAIQQAKEKAAQDIANARNKINQLPKDGAPRHSFSPTTTGQFTSTRDAAEDLKSRIRARTISSV